MLMLIMIDVDPDTYGHARKNLPDYPDLHSAALITKYIFLVIYNLLVQLNLNSFEIEKNKSNNTLIVNTLP